MKGEQKKVELKITSAKEQRIEAILQCPITKTRLSFLDTDALKKLNVGIQSGKFQHLSGMEVKINLAAALACADHTYIYPVVDDVLILVPSFAIIWKRDACDKLRQPDMSTETDSVMKFYDQVGWQEADDKVYIDADRFEDLRPVSAEYIHKCHLRLRKYIPKTGTYLLDAASGPVQYPEYLSYADGYEYRICADISFVALKAAKKKLGDKGIYLQCDITCLPLKDSSVDSFVSLHTIYHIPASKQPMVFLELFRVLKDQCSGVVVYTWGRHSLLMKLFMPKFSIAASFIKWLKVAFRRVSPPLLIDALKSLFGRSSGLPGLPKALATKQPMIKEPRLYFYAHDYTWYRQEIDSRCKCEIACWRSVSVPFLKRYIHDRFFGRQFLSFLFCLENVFPRLLGKYGQYPIIICIKE